MIKSNWPFLIALALGVATHSPTLHAATSGHRVEHKAERGAGSQNSSTDNTLSASAIDDREKHNQSDCRTPKECSSENRAQQELVAEQTAAEAAVAQAHLSRWQTLIGTLGVIAVIATLIYTHIATRAAIRSVELVMAVESARVCVVLNPGICVANGDNIHFNLYLTNVGKTTALIKEFCLQGSETGFYKDFSAQEVTRSNTTLKADSVAPFSDLDFIAGHVGYNYIVGYYEFQNVFKKKPIRDYFCYEVKLPIGPFPGGAAYSGPIVLKSRIDLDWPPDESF